MSPRQQPPKYHRDAEFNDPIVRCDSCAKIVKLVAIRQLGTCPHCGNRRIRNVLTLTSDEMDQVRAWGIDPDWIALFEGVEYSHSSGEVVNG